MFRTIYVPSGLPMTEDNFILRYSEDFAPHSTENLDFVMSREVQAEEGLDVEPGFCWYGRETTSTISKSFDQYFEILFVYSFFSIRQRNPVPSLTLSDLLLAYYYPANSSNSTRYAGQRILTPFKQDIIRQLVAQLITERGIMRQFEDFFRREDPRAQQRMQGLPVRRGAETQIWARTPTIPIEYTPSHRIRLRPPSELGFTPPSDPAYPVDS
jgi:hypothetical protein